MSDRVERIDDFKPLLVVCDDCGVPLRNDWSCPICDAEKEKAARAALEVHP